MKNNRIKTIIRKNLPETNSSSSHSVVICMSKYLLKEGDPEFDLDIRDGVLYIPNHEAFGWDYFKTNSALEKLQYVCGIYCSDVDSGSGHKRINKLKRILCNYLGISDVRFQWIEEYAERKSECEGDECDDLYYDYPEINHNSHDIFEEITESEDTIINFIFNPQSWLYGGNDNSGAPHGFYDETEIETSDNPDAVASIYFPDDIGRLDFEIENFPCRDIFDEMSLSDPDEILRHIIYIPSTRKTKIITKSEYYKRMRGKFIEEEGEEIFLLVTESSFVENGKQYLLYANDKFTECALEEYNSRRSRNSNGGKFPNYFDVINYIIKESGKVSEGVDYVKFPTELKYNKLGITI